MSTHYKNKWSYLTPKEEAAVNSKLHENLFISTCSFHWQYDSSWEAYGKNSFIKKTYVVGTHCNIAFQCLPTTHDTENKGNYFEIYT